MFGGFKGGPHGPRFFCVFELEVFHGPQFSASGDFKGPAGPFLFLLP